MNVQETAGLMAGLIIIKKMTLGDPGSSGSYGVSEGGAGANGSLPKQEIITIENTADIAAGSTFDLTNSTYFNPVLSQTSTRNFTNLVLVNLSACPIDIQLNNDPTKYFTLTASSEFIMQGSRILNFKNLSIKNRSSLAAIEENQLVIVMW